MADPFDLERFVETQEPVIDDVLAELRRGSKAGHWMWFVFPQMKGLGHSWLAEKFGISSRAEAEAYLAHPLLGPRLIECTKAVNAVEGRTAEQIFGSVDTMKFRSSMTLFAAISGGGVFGEALRKYFGGQGDGLTLDWLSSATP